MLCINIFVLFTFLHLYTKIQKPIYLLPIFLTGFNYLYFGHVIKSSSKAAGDTWSLLGGLEIGILGMHLS